MTESSPNQDLLCITLHSFTLGDIEDIEIYAADPIYKWEQTAAGKWALAHAHNVQWKKDLDFKAMGYRVTIYGYLEPKLAVEYTLRYGGPTS